MKKLFLLLSVGFILSTFTVIGQEQQKEIKEPKKIKVTESEKATLKSKNVRAKKVTIYKTDAVQRKKVSNSETAIRKEEK